jgi:hypothetical protein
MANNPTPPSAAELLYGSTDYGNRAPKPAASPPVVTRPAGPSVLSAAQALYGGSHPAPPQPAAPARVQAAPVAAAAPTVPATAAKPESNGPSAAELLYGDLPQDGIQYGEPVLDRPEAVPLDLPKDMAAAAQAGELDLVRHAFVDAGIGHQLANALVEDAKAAYLAGPMPADKVAAMEVSTMAALTKKWGSKTEAKIAAAQSVIADAAVRWPGIKDWLEQSGMGNCPKLIQRLAARAERRPGKR